MITFILSQHCRLFLQIQMKLSSAHKNMSTNSIYYVMAPSLHNRCLNQVIANDSLQAHEKSYVLYILMT